MSSTSSGNDDADELEYCDYTDESMLKGIMEMVSKDLSEPYSIFTYRYFLHAWPSLCICAYVKNSDGERRMVATVVCKLDKVEDEGEARLVGYIGMVTVDASQRKRGVGKKLAKLGISRMYHLGCREISLETEVGL
jgi:peptide alpha-N-acetyltransferase